MSHVDDGALHAYLDGALDALTFGEADHIRRHLESCLECARRLEEERALRDDAHAILSSADPELRGLPSLEEMRTLAEEAPAGAPTGSRLRRLSWAASIVVAVGAGWMLRDSQAGRFDTEAPVASGPALELLADETAAREAQVDEAEADGEAEAARRTFADASAAQGPPPATPAGAGVSDDRDLRETTTTVAGAGLAAMEDSLLALLGDATVSTVEAKAAAPGSAARVGVVPIEPPALAAVRTDEVRRGEEEARRVSEDRQVGMSPEGDAPAAARLAGSRVPTLTVPGLPVLSIVTSPDDLPAGSVRVLQLLEGDTLELLHLPGDLSPLPSEGDAGDGRTEVRVRSGSGWVVGRAWRDADEIRELLHRLLGGR